MYSRILLRGIFLFTFILIKFISLAQVVADFSATAASGCAPLVVRFTDQSTGNPTSWKWELGGSVSYLQNPSVSYFTPGKYTIRLVVKNAVSEDSIIKTQFIEVYANPVVDFFVSDTSGCYPLPVHFTDTTYNTSGNISSWLWDFGDGVTSDLQNPDHTYNEARNFNVTLQVKNDAGCVSTFTKTSIVQITSGVLAQFTNNNPRTCTPPVTINFENQSTGTGILSYKWNFGDNFISALSNPSHNYTVQGSYPVSLIVTNTNGCADTIIKQNAVTIGAVRAGFTINNSACQGNSISFSNTSSPIPAAVIWSFGDGTFSSEPDAVKTYVAAGTYDVKMVANFGACSDSITKNVTVLAKPFASFDAADTASCKSPFNVAFNSHADSSAGLLWDFGDNDTSTASNPSHIYTVFGNYNIRLIVNNTNGCNDTIVKPGYITVKRPGVAIKNVPDSGCVPFIKTLSADIGTSEPIASYLWDFGDNTTSTSASSTHTYPAEGFYNLSLIIVTASGCPDTVTVPRGIVASNKPAANFTATPTSTCAKTSISFKDLSAGEPNSWLWDFGDKTISTLKNPNHLYKDTGFFDIKLTIWKGGCPDSITFPQYIRINPPVGNFTVKSDCAAPFDRVFTDKSIGADEWHWDFGDGGVSTLQNPLHTYRSTGLYNVSLRVVNNTYGCDYTTSKQVQIINSKAQFAASDTSVCKGSQLNFTTGLSLSEISIFNWYFGDERAAVNSPAGFNTMSYAYTRTGTYSVRLVIVDKNSCTDTLVKNNYITVYGPTARFIPSVPGACLNNAVSFNDATSTDGTHAIQQWIWNYGDGKIDSLLSPPFTHLYSSPGSYTILLKVIDSKGCEDRTRFSTPLVISKPTADFLTPDSASCPGKDVRFANQSTGPNLVYAWNFGDMATSAMATPTHSYNEDGTYTVKLAVTDMYGCKDSLTKSNYISITSPKAYFRMSDSLGNCPPLIINFTNLSGSTVSQKWDFGDNTVSIERNPVHFYTYPGVYTVTLTSMGQGGCISSFQKRIVIKGPVGHFSYNPLSGCQPLTVNFTASTNGRNSFLWDFNDGSTVTGTDSLVSYTYTYPGKYVPKMILIDRAGCHVPIRGRDTILVSGIGANFGFTTRPLCDSGSISFTDSSFVMNDSIVNYKWNFGDNATSSFQNPVHAYNIPGNFYPSLVAVSLAGCTDTLLSPIPIKIVASPRIKISSSPNGCIPLTVTFKSELIVPDTSILTWKWNLGNGNISFAATPDSQHYTSAGIYKISLTGINSSGCKDSATKNIEAFSIPVVSAGQDAILCKGSSLTLQASGAITYIWSPASGLSCNDCGSPVANTSASTTYVVTGTSAQGCTSSDSMNITVKDKFVFKYSSNDSVCRGQSKKLLASGASSYSWSPAQSVDNPTISNPVATPDTNTVFRVIGADNLGCFKDTGYISVRVNALPTVEAGADKTINVGQTTDLVPDVSADVLFVNWQPTTGLFRNFYPGITVKPAENTEYTVEVKNKGGCMARDRVTVHVICNGSNIFIPNTFSPNNDGTNDVFYPRGTGLFKIKTLQLFTRWGEKIFEKNNFDANNPADGWDGSSKGKKLNPDVFVYTVEVICDNGSVLVYRGNTALVR